MTRRAVALLPALLLTALVAAATGCEAGPSAFERRPGPEDTADASSLPGIPQAMEVETAGVDTEGVSSAAGAADTLRSVPVAPTVPLPDSTVPPSFERPGHVRGIYLTAWAAGSTKRVDALLDLARRTEVNTFVIDIKDASGYVSHRSEVPLAQESGATGQIRIRDLPGLLRRLHAEGIYPIARIVIVQDPILAAARPDMAIQDRDGGAFRDSKGFYWLNPYDRRVWDYHVELAREMARMGFPEIQWDYVRFPDVPASEKARLVYPGAGDTSQPDIISAFLAYAREKLADEGVVVTADVFGVITAASRDVGIGHVWESLIDDVDVALPMVYPSHYWKGSFGHAIPNAYPYEVVGRALRDALRRSAAVPGAGATRPWLQDFTLGQPRYGAPEVRAQIQAAYDVGIQDWILWNPGSRYTEAALEPVGGFAEEPLIRVGGRIVPVSQRSAPPDTLAPVR
ncbi:MAG: hypothetical protein FIA95_06110 [Gemmatimonadetes bacterium]|nr:hypothetical protein [Gemmatimonadota bacterium]